MVEPGKAFRVAFLGTPRFAVPSLQALLASRHRVALVITQPDRPRGRGHRPHPSPVKVLAEAHHIPVLQPERLKDSAFLDAVRAFQLDLGVVAAYGRILPDEVLRLPALGLVNVHASLLPKYRGAAPVHRAIVNGEWETGVTIMRVVKALDAGPMLAKASRPIGPDETSDRVEDDLAELGARLLVTTLDQMALGRSSEIAQEDRLASHAPRLTKEEGHIDWTEPAQRIHDRVRGLHPWPHAYAFLAGTRLILLRTRPDPEGAVSAATPGEILDAHGNELRVACGAGTGLRILELQPEGRRPMTAQAFLAGHPDLGGLVLH